jgi:UDP-N-acetyl-D-glucosamine dehydrogenase
MMCYRRQDVSSLRTATPTLAWAEASSAETDLGGLAGKQAIAPWHPWRRHTFDIPIAGSRKWLGEKLNTDLLVIGLGYVGLPLAREAAIAGLNVVGFDVNEAVAARLNSGISHVGDITDADVAEMLRHGFRATARETELASPGTIVICVPTPLSTDGIPDLGAVEAASELAGRVLRTGTLVILESTSYPGTTDEVVRTLVEKISGLAAGTGFSLAFSPERVDPGNREYNLRNTPKVVGGHTWECAEAAVRFYGKLCDEVIRAKSIREAELAKLIENTYRHVNIALVNEMAIFCHELNIDLWDAIRCAGTKPFGFEAFYPGPGVGGHCIPIDPNYLSYKVRSLGYPFRFVELAQEINQRMPVYVVARAAELLNSHAKPLKGARVLLLGVTYKKDVADTRESPVPAIARRLLDGGAVVSYHDPYVLKWRVGEALVPRADDLLGELQAADLVILLQDHAAYDKEVVATASRLVLDTRGRLTGNNVVAI